MKSWIKKLRISNAMDTGEPLPASLRQGMADSSELRTFARDLEALDAALKDTAPSPAATPELHGSIMRSLEGADRPARLRLRAPVLRWLPASALVVLALGIWWAMQPPPSPRPEALNVAVDALELRSELSRTMPDAVVAPLSEELARLNRDVDNTTKFLLAALP